MTSSTIESDRESHVAIRSMNLIEKAFRDVSREDWKARMGEQDKVYLLEDHVSNMKGILSDLNYETYCIDRLIENTKKMDIGTMKEYTNMMESIAYFYCKTLNKDMATAIITGLVTRTKDVKGVEKYYNWITLKLGGEISKYSKSMSVYGSRIDALSVELRNNSSGFLKFFKRKRVLVIGRKMKKLEARSGKVRSKLEKTKALASMIGKK